MAYLLGHPLEALRPLLAKRAEDWNYVATLAERLRSHLLDLPIGRLEHGFCHGDVNWNNVHVDAERSLTMLDFDFCGMGWRAYDLATFRWVTWTRRAEQTIWPAFLRGYEEVRSLADVDVRAIANFVAVRHLWSMGLRGQRASLGFEGIRDGSFERAVSFLRQWDADHLSL